MADNELRPVSDVLAEINDRVRGGRSAVARVWATGFSSLDGYLGGGLRAGELTLLGGPQGLGKTTFALQVARNVAAGGGAVIYFSFEHDEETLLQRLLAIEASEVAGHGGMTLRRLRAALDAPDSAGLTQTLGGLEGGPQAVTALAQHGRRLHVHQSSGKLTTAEAIRGLVLAAAAEEPPVVVVDYLQKVAVPGGSSVEEERVTQVVEALKDLALEARVPVFSVVAADWQGLAAGRRLRIQNLRGSSALAYEADVVLILNEKYDVVARHHLVYDGANAERFRSWAVLSIEKNRSGLDRVDLEFRKRFDQGCFDSAGQAVAEQLVDERIFRE